MEAIELRVSDNPGHPPRPLARVASGGEQSRITLSLQVLISERLGVPTLIFDEVDVGIGGGVAEIVGRLLRGLGSGCQVLCVTHLPQVAAQGHQHLFVSKRKGKASTGSAIASLEDQARVNEIARMLGGVDITDTTLSHADELLRNAQQEA
jgi:DNA repair protein RecN (Recombination protein N)